MMVIWIFLIIFIVYFNIYTKETCEDSFHKETHKNYKSLDDSPVICILFKKIEEYQSIKSIIETERTFTRFFEENKSVLKCKDCSNESVLHARSDAFHLSFIDNKQYILLKFNHYYIGGSSFLKIKSDILKHPVIKLPYSSYAGFIYIPRLLHDWYCFMQSPFQRLPRSGQIFRRSESFVFDKHEYQNIPKRSFVLYHIIKKLYDYLTLDRPMRVMIPVAFHQYKGINNNVGVIFLLFDGSETVDTFSKVFEDKKYMALATNTLLVSKLNYLFSNNISIRESVDVVVTSIYANSELDYSLLWTTKIMPLESVYVGVYSRITKDNVNTTATYTIATSQFTKPA